MINDWCRDLELEWTTLRMTFIEASDNIALYSKYSTRISPRRYLTIPKVLGGSGQQKDQLQSTVVHNIVQNFYSAVVTKLSGWRKDCTTLVVVRKISSGDAATVVRYRY